MISDPKIGTQSTLCSVLSFSFFMSMAQKVFLWKLISFYIAKQVYLTENHQCWWSKMCWTKNDLKTIQLSIISNFGINIFTSMTELQFHMDPKDLVCYLLLSIIIFTSRQLPNLAVDIPQGDFTRPCNIRQSLLSDLRPRVGTYDLRSYGGEHRGSEADQKLSRHPGPLFVEWPNSQVDARLCAHRRSPS